MKRYIFILAILATSFVLLIGCKSKEEDHSGHDHSLHDHSKHEAPAKEINEHSEDEHDHGAEQQHIELTSDAIRMADIQFDKVEMQKIKKTIKLSGEVGFNEDHLIHVVPRFPGIVKSTNKRLGDYVKAGDLLAVVESNESLSKYKISSPTNGTIIEKHITSGEYVTDDGAIYVIANLSNVWINLSIYAKDIQNIQRGASVEIRAVGNDISATGKISYVSPVFNETSRIAKTRVVLSNSQRKWRPGMFVSGIIHLEDKKEVRVVKLAAVQTLHETSVVFVRESGDDFLPLPVVTGASDNEWVEIIKGLNLHDEYVSKGAFELKAKIITGSLGDHAGHGH